MPVTEIALLRLKTEGLLPSTKAGLLEAQQAQSEQSNHKVHLLRQVEDAACIYLLGGWESIEKHMNDWIPSATNQRLLQQLQGDLEVKWMFHLDLDPSTSQIPLDAPMLAISRYFVDSLNKEEFENILRAGGSNLVVSTPFPCCGGWRIDRDGEDEEFVLFSGWKEVDDYFGIVDSEGLKGFREIEGLIKGVEVKQIRSEESL
ncbi:uncharacterized protein N7511_001983 [Penicillium nucicola]|uniref:uncharacterized protein n=1 Tax=Penicillium nucicola TaxID=1850975 RepID=UPI00254557C0|nr:uncharacterized protein N7511_001983 [Penicillium nucicola]KAJ5769932.1 hypothetical protein N7511_001983 [Penicillium nucicola]